jgi:hypothetical protein
MELQQASLGSSPSINLGGFIPAAQRRPSVLEQALAGFISGVAGSVANKGTDALLTRDVSGRAAADTELQSAGMAPEKRQGAMGRMFTPMSEEQFQRAKAIAEDKNYHNKVVGLDEKRLGNEVTRTADARESDKQRMSLASQEAQDKRNQYHNDATLRASQADKENARGDRVVKVSELAQDTNAKEAQNRAVVNESTARHNNAAASQVENMNRDATSRRKQAIVSEVKKEFPGNESASFVLDSLGSKLDYTTDEKFRSDLRSSLQNVAKGETGEGIAGAAKLEKRRTAGGAWGDALKSFIDSGNANPMASQRMP